MALIGNTYVQDTDPGAVGYGYFWQKMNGDRSARNTSNTAWVAQGNVNQEYSGAAPLSGFTAQGAISGATGLAQLASADFQALRLNAVNVATVNDLSDAQTAILKSCDAKINSGISGITSAQTYSAFLAFDEGILDDARVVPLPQFSDRPARMDEIVFMGVEPYQFTDVFVGNFTWMFYCQVNPINRQINCKIVNSNNQTYAGTAKYHIIALRKD